MTDTSHDSPPARTMEEFREHIRTLAETPRPRSDRNHRHRGRTPYRRIPATAGYQRPEGNP